MEVSFSKSVSRFVKFNTNIILVNTQYIYSVNTMYLTISVFLVIKKLKKLENILKVTNFFSTKFISYKVVFFLCISEILP